jgi:hypothetical protein
MKEWLRRIKAAIGMGLTWAAGWMPIGVLFALSLSVVGLGPPGLAGFVGTSAVLFGVLGFCGGSIFSAVLRLAEGRRRFDELSLPRFALWGGVGGLLLGAMAGMVLFTGPGMQLADAVVAGVTTLLGAGSAAGTLALARRAEDEGLLEAGADVPQVGATEKERKKLLEDGG